MIAKGTALERYSLVMTNLSKVGSAALDENGAASRKAGRAV